MLYYIIYLCNGKFNNSKKNKSTTRNHPDIDRFDIRNFWHTSCKCLTKSAHCKKCCYTEGDPTPILSTNMDHKWTKTYGPWFYKSVPGGRCSQFDPKTSHGNQNTHSRWEKCPDQIISDSTFEHKISTLVWLVFSYVSLGHWPGFNILNRTWDSWNSPYCIL